LKFPSRGFLSIFAVDVKEFRLQSQFFVEPIGKHPADSRHRREEHHRVAFAAQLPAVGESIARAIRELVTDGRLPMLDRLGTKCFAITGLSIERILAAARKYAPTRYRSAP
jgi:hypothetical protein